MTYLPDCPYSLDENHQVRVVECNLRDTMKLLEHECDEYVVRSHDASSNLNVCLTYRDYTLKSGNGRLIVPSGSRFLKDVEKRNNRVSRRIKYCGIQHD